ncbi:MAG TPA: thiol-disulfide isomerase [Elusimicrobia bacterium]|nr:thiol-disulfide isomerase [Elusimicrobiota bacterium]
MKTIYVLLGCALLWFAYRTWSGGGAADLYDPSRDAAADIETSLDVAKNSGRRVLIVVGNNGCGWCLRLHEFIQDDAELRGLQDSRFVTVHVNMSPQKPNAEVLGRYPGLAGTPHLFVLDKDGTLLHSQDTEQLEAGESYDRAKLLDFLKSW